MKISNAVLRTVTICVLLAIAGSVAAQQAYPNKAIRVIVPFPPGGSNDIVGRIVGQKLGERLGVQTLIENRGGGNGVIGTEALLKSAPDGYTIMVISISTHILTTLLMATPYDPVKDFAAVATTDSSESVLTVHPSVPANTLREFIALAKSKPGQLNYASSSTLGQVVTALFAMKAGINMQHIPYKGAGPALADLMGGQIQVFFNTPGSIVGYVKSGKLKALAVTGETRLPALPAVPTMAEAGLPDIDVRNYRGVLAPHGTPKAIVERLSAEVASILNMSEVKEKFASQGTDPFISTPEQFAARMKADVIMYSQVVKSANIKID